VIFVTPSVAVGRRGTLILLTITSAVTEDKGEGADVVSGDVVDSVKTLSHQVAEGLGAEPVEGGDHDWGGEEKAGFGLVGGAFFS